MDTLRSVGEVARRLGVKEATVRRWVFLRRITYVKVGSAVRIPEMEIRRIIAEGTKERLPVGTASTLVM